MMKRILSSRTWMAAALVLGLSASAVAQVGVNTSGNPPDASSGLDVDFADKGVLIPRVALTGSGDVTTIPSPATSLLVYNTGSGGLSPAGFYYWNGTAWTEIGGGGGGGGGTTVICPTPEDEATIYYEGGTGQWTCTDVLEVDPTWGSVSVNAFSGPNSSWNFLVEGDAAIDGPGITSTSFTLSVGGDAHVDNGISIGTTTSAPAGGLLVNGNATFNGSITANDITAGTDDLLTIGDIRLTSPSSVTSWSSMTSYDYVMMDASGNLFRGMGPNQLAAAVATTNETTSTSLTAVTGASSHRHNFSYLRATSVNYYPSSRHFKKDIEPLSIDKEKFLSLRPYSYTYKENYGGEKTFGLIAEDVAVAAPELAHMGPKRLVDENGDVLFDENGNEKISETEQMPDGVYYDRIGVYLLPIVAEHETTIKAQQAEIEELRSRLLLQEQLLSKIVMSNPAFRDAYMDDGTLKAEGIPIKKE